ncbi:endonuclease/exonuclease/phosphatase family metal-dependent hydrolase [Flavobacteriaceae bacterium MAR_2009_75]|nr:endonuclease/exonuclease/phosphatase family metal-dependent hydrolase [Flavobacteriaceae bacterium MAR_2009_75]
MKGLSLFNKIVYALNVIVFSLLLIACAIPYLTDEFFSFLSFLSLSVPLLVIINLVFFLYWLLQLKRQMLLSLFILILGYFVLDTFFIFGNNPEMIEDENLKVMSFNVHGFKVFGDSDRLELYEKIKGFVRKENPDIIGFQEVGYRMDETFLDYPYGFVKRIQSGDKVHLGIFSKYPIIKAEIIHFPNSINNGSYADILYKNDTIRFYNVHMQSLGITPGSGNVRSKTPEQLYEKLSTRFKRQLKQAKMIEDHKAKCPHPIILCADMNNTQFSNVYQALKGESQDSFIEKGIGFGRTYNLFQFPLRIDYILADHNFKVISHKNYDEKLSDHFPVMASFRLKQ